MNENRPWQQVYDDYGIEEPDLEPKPVHSMLEDTADNHPEAGVHQEGRTTEYPDLLERAGSLAYWLHEHGVGKGDHVAVLLPTSVEFLVTSYGVSLSGATFVPVPVLESTEDVVTNLEKVDPSAVVGGGPHGKMAEEVENNLETGLLATTDEAGEDLGEVSHPSGESYRADVDPKEDVYAVMFTGGTSGVPKGCMLTHANVTANAGQIQASMSRAADLMSGSGSVVNALPLYHAYGHTTSHAFVRIGTNQLLVPDPRDYSEIERLTEEHSPMAMVGVPTQFHESADRELDVMGISGSAPLKDETRKRFSESGSGVTQGYGLSEMSPVTHFDVEGIVEGVAGTSNRSLAYDVSTIGVPVPATEIKLLDTETEDEIPLDEAAESDVTAEMLVDGPQRMKGYVEGGEGFHDCFVRTGDVVRVDGRGRFYVVDRVKDMINVSGLKVYSEEVESELQRHPDVERAAVVGLPDPSRPGSELVGAYLEADDTVTEDDVVEHLDGKVSRQAVPDHVEILDDLPLTHIGKIDKEQLKQRYRES